MEERVPFFIAVKDSKIGAYAHFTLLQNKTASLLASYVDCTYQRKESEFPPNNTTLFKQKK